MPVRVRQVREEENGGQGEFVSGWDTGKLRNMGFGVESENGQRQFYEGCIEATWLTPQQV